MFVHLVLALALVTPTASPPETPAARAHRHFEAQQWEEAIEALIEAYAEDPDPAYLYARAQAERMRGDCRVAVALYRRFLDSGPKPKQRADTERHIRLCEELLFTQEVQEQHEPVAAPTPEPRSEPTDTTPRRDPIAPALLGTGLGLAAIGMAVAIVGSNARRAAADAPTEEEYENDGRRGTVMLATGLSLAGVGVALVAGAVARFAVVAKRRRTTVAPMAGLGSQRRVGLTLVTRF